MFTIDVMLKFAPLPLSVQRKTEEEAEARRYADQVTFEGYLP